MTGCLPQRNTYAADFQNWLSTYLAEVEPAARRLLLHEYGTWRVLPRIHRPRERRPPYSTFQYAKSRIRAAHRFLIWLGERDTPLAEATQEDVDEFLVQNKQLIGTLEPFFRWTTRTRKSRKLVCRKQRSDQPKPAITPEECWQLLRWLLHDNNLEVADRVMGVIILTYAVPLTKTLMIQADDIRIIDNGDTGTEVYLRLGPAEVRLPPVLDQLVVEQLRCRRLPRAGAAIVTGPWLYPGVKAGQALSYARALVRLCGIGLHPGLGRSRALLHLAARIEAPLVARALGITPGTADRWLGTCRPHL